MLMKCSVKAINLVKNFWVWSLETFLSMAVAQKSGVFVTNQAKFSSFWFKFLDFLVKKGSPAPGPSGYIPV